jgi:1,4-dihydroxy-6-naphthoate synthase
LCSGAALGKGVGPLLITHSEALIKNLNPNLLTLIPGEHTTAHFLLQFAYPEFKHKKAVVFHEIEQSLIHKKADYGVIIHENRFTYTQKGLHKVADLGSIWEEKTNSAIPLGGIFIHKSISTDIQSAVNQLIRKSIEYAYANPEKIRNYIKQYAQEMDDAVIQQHIDLYVNEYSIDLGIEGKSAVLSLFHHISEIYGTEFPSPEHIFVA